MQAPAFEFQFLVQHVQLGGPDRGLRAGGDGPDVLLGHLRIVQIPQRGLKPLQPPNRPPRLVAVEVITQPVFKVVKSSPLFTVGRAVRGINATGSHAYDVHPDGQRFLITMPTGGSDITGAPRVLTVVTNWTSSLKK